MIMTNYDVKLLINAGQDRRLLMTLLLDYYHPECLKPGPRCGTKSAHVADVDVPFVLWFSTWFRMVLDMFGRDSP